MAGAGTLLPALPALVRQSTGHKKVQLSYRKAAVTDLERCAVIRGLTRDNPIDRETLKAIGVTTENWAPKMEGGIYIGYVAEDQDVVVAYCYGDIQSGEVLVLAVLPDYEGSGVGKKLLSLVAEELFLADLDELWLAASANPAIRAHGFYRHIGWQPTLTYDHNGDEILKLGKNDLPCLRSSGL